MGLSGQMSTIHLSASGQILIFTLIKNPELCDLKISSRSCGLSDQSCAVGQGS